MSFLDELKRRNVIRVAIGYLAGAWLLIQVLETLFPIFGIPETSIRVVVVIAAIGFVPVLVASWLFELTPEGLKRDSEARQLRQKAPSHRAVDRLIAIVLTLAVVYFAVDKFVLDPSRDAVEIDAARQEGRAEALIETFGNKSIVVLPFENISSDPAQEYLGDGLAEELLNLLARVEGLRVISRTSAFAFKGSQITSAEIAHRLNVSYVLEGSVRKSSDTLRITAKLIDARVDAPVWSETYDHSSENIFDIQDSVAGEVVGHLKAQLALDPPKAQRHDPVAYALYLQADQVETEEAKRELLQQALEIEPEFLDAMAELAYSHRGSGREAEWSGNKEAAEWHYEQYRSLVDQVLAQDPGHPYVNAHLAWDELLEPDLRRAAMHAERALKSEPTHFGALTTAGEVLTRLWRAEQAIPVLRYASERDPLTGYHFDNLAKAYMNNGQYEAAEEACRVLLVLNPESGNHHTGWCIGQALLLQGKAREALQFVEDNVIYDPLRWHGRTLVLHALARTEEAQVELTRLLEAAELFGIEPEYDGIYWYIGTAYAWIGATDQAFESFERQREVAPRIFTSMGDSPLYDNLLDDERWQPFLASVNVDPDFLASVEFNPKLPAEIRLP